MLNELPEDGTVLHNLSVQDEDEIIDSTEIEPEEPTVHCEQELGPDQWGGYGYEIVR